MDMFDFATSSGTGAGCNYSDGYFTLTSPLQDDRTMRGGFVWKLSIPQLPQERPTTSSSHYKAVLHDADSQDERTQKLFYILESNNCVTKKHTSLPHYHVYIVCTQQVGEGKIHRPLEPYWLACLRKVGNINLKQGEECYIAYLIMKGPHFLLINKQVCLTQKPTQAYLLEVIQSGKRASELLKVAPMQYMFIPISMFN